MVNLHRAGTIQSEQGNPNLERQMSHDLSNIEMLALKLVFSMYLIWNSHGGHKTGGESMRVENSSEVRWGPVCVKEEWGIMEQEGLGWVVNERAR